MLQLLTLLLLCVGLAVGTSAGVSAESGTGAFDLPGGTPDLVASGQVEMDAQVGPDGGRWIRVSLSRLVAEAMVGRQVVYTAPVTAGTPRWPTPTGTFRIQRRVYNETMDSATVGIPRGAPGGYYLPGVLYTQYFTPQGHSLHYNYWSPRSAFGRTAGSHGCVGMLLNDAAYFWSFATVGTPVVIGY